MTKLELDEFVSELARDLRDVRVWLPDGVSPVGEAPDGMLEVRLVLGNRRISLVRLDKEAPAVEVRERFLKCLTHLLGGLS